MRGIRSVEVVFLLVCLLIAGLLERQSALLPCDRDYPKQIEVVCSLNG